MRWEVLNRPEAECFRIVTERAEVVAEVSYYQPHARLTANIIASAPQLLRAGEGLIDLWEQPYTERGDQWEADAEEIEYLLYDAVKKARYGR